METTADDGHAVWTAAYGWDDRYAYGKLRRRFVGMAWPPTGTGRAPELCKCASGHNYWDSAEKCGERLARHLNAVDRKAAKEAAA